MNKDKSPEGEAIQETVKVLLASDNDSQGTVAVFSQKHDELTADSEYN